MQFDDPKSVFEAAAAKPTREIDLRALKREGARLRRVRNATVSAGLALSVTAAFAGFGAFGADGVPEPVVAPSEEPCDERAAQTPVVDNPDARVRDLRDRLERELDRLRRSRVEAAEELGGTVESIDGRDLDEARKATRAAEQALQAALEKLARRQAQRDDLYALPVCEDDAGPTPPRRRTALGVEADLRRARCSLRAPDFVEAPALRDDKWCTFEIVFENRADRGVRLDDVARLLLLEDATLTYSTAYTDAEESPRIADQRVEPGETVSLELYFAMDPLAEPTELRVGTGPDAVNLSLDYDCPDDLTRRPRTVCDFTP